MNDRANLKIIWIAYMSILKEFAWVDMLNSRNPSAELRAVNTTDLGERHYWGIETFLHLLYNSYIYM